MDNVLRDLFDFQRFSKEPKLERVINETHNELYLIEISDEMLEAAAGGKSLTEEDKNKKNDLL